MALTTFQDLTNVETIMHDLSAVVARQDLPAWRLTHPLCAAGAAELISCLKLSAHQLQEAAQHPFSSSLRHVSRVECSTRQAQTQAPLCPSWTASLPQVVAKLSKLVHLSLKVRKEVADCQQLSPHTSTSPHSSLRW
jgi:hypothetical protein